MLLKLVTRLPRLVTEISVCCYPLNLLLELVTSLYFAISERFSLNCVAGSAMGRILFQRRAGSMSANVVQLHKPSSARLRCSACGIDAACDCGVAYITAGAYAAQLVAAHPEMSDRSIAAASGVAHKTVSRARAATTG